MSRELAERIVTAFDTRTLIEPFASEMGLEEAYAVAAEVHALRVERGERPVGRKIGFTNRGLWEHFGVGAPIWAYVYDATTIHAPGGRAEAAIGRLLQPLVEPEVELHFARTPPPGAGEQELLDCIDWIALGVELVQCPYPGWRLTAPDSVVACALHGALVVGTPVPVAGIEDCAAKLREFRVELRRDGERMAEGSGADALGSPLLAMAELVEVLAGQGRPVQAGEVITTGTLTMPQPAQAGARWSVRADGIELPALELLLTAD